MPSNFSIVNGVVNLATANAKNFMVAVPCRLLPNIVEMHLSAAVNSPQASSHILHRGPQRITASVAGATPESGGRIFSSTYTAADGVVCRVVAQRRTNINAKPVTCNVLLRFREGAAGRRLKMRMLDHPRAAVRWGEVVGNFDILTLEQAEAEEGIVVPPGLRQFYAPGAFGFCCEVEELTPARTVMQSVQKPDGGTATVAVVKRVRSFS